MSTLANKVAIVTGASRGIGARIAVALGKAGANVVVNYVTSRDAAEQVVSELGEAGAHAVAVQADVSKPADAARLFDVAIERFGKVDILVNNAGVLIFKRIEETSDEDYAQTFDINVRGTFLMLREASRRLENGGRIVNLSSSVTRLMVPGYGVYSATKGAVEQLTRVFAKEAGGCGITVNSVSPGPTNTELFNQDKNEETIKRLAEMAALRRIGEPDEVARVVLFLVSDEASWVTGQNIGVNGGFA